MEYNNDIEAIILSGGLGTRLKSEIPDLPKCMAPVAGKPFIDHVIGFFQDAGIRKFIFALGYLHELILDHLASNWPDLDFDYTVEHEPLGTGGALGFALQKVKSANFMVLNGDTLYKIDYKTLLRSHVKNHAFVTLALKPMKDFDRYGTVEINEEQKIIAFNEKKTCVSGLINGGIYLINTSAYKALQVPYKYSFEKDILEANVDTGTLFGEVFTDYFIDIGIPEDFKKANDDLK